MNFSACTNKSKKIAQRQQNFAWTYVRVSVTFRNSGLFIICSLLQCSFVAPIHMPVAPDHGWTIVGEGEGGGQTSPGRRAQWEN